MSVHDGGQTPFQRRYIEGADDAVGEGNVVEGIVGFEPIEEPKPGVMSSAGVPLSWITEPSNQLDRLHLVDQVGNRNLFFLVVDFITSGSIFAQ